MGYMHRSSIDQSNSLRSFLMSLIHQIVVVYKELSDYEGESTDDGEDATW